MRDAPRTDTFIRELPVAYDHSDVCENTEALFDFARTLELELQQANEKLEKWHKFGVQAAYVFGVATIGSCTCMTRSPDLRHHKENCCFRKIKEVTATLTQLQQP